MSIPEVELQKPILPSPLDEGWQSAIVRYFRFNENGTNFRIEVLAGIAIFSIFLTRFVFMILRFD
jgi:hypothetical protein